VRQQTNVPSRIQPLSSVLGDEDEDLEGLVGSLAVRSAARAQRSGLRQLSGQLHYDEVPRSAWLSLDPHSGEAQFYHRTAAERIEAAFRSGRASVPLAGLGKELDNATIKFSRGEEAAKIVETSLKGGTRDVMRIAVPGSMMQAIVSVTKQDGQWRLLSEKEKTTLLERITEEFLSKKNKQKKAENEQDEEDDDDEDDSEQIDAELEDLKASIVEERRLVFTGNEIVSGENKLPPVNRNQRTYFINAAASEYWA